MQVQSGQTSTPGTLSRPSLTAHRRGDHIDDVVPAEHAARPQASAPEQLTPSNVRAAASLIGGESSLALAPGIGDGHAAGTSSVLQTRLGASQGADVPAIEAALQHVGAHVAGFVAKLWPADEDPVKLGARAQALEDAAFVTLETLTPKNIGEAEQALDAWVTGLEKRGAAGTRPEGMEYLTVLHALKQGLLDHSPGLEAIRDRMKSVLQRADQALLGRDRSLDQILADGLPKGVLKTQSADARKIHAALFAPASQRLPYALGQLLDVAGESASGRIAAGLMAGALFTSVGAQVVGGAIQGYVIGTLVERGIHEFAGHASPPSLKRAKDLLSRFGPLGESIYRWLDATRFAHSEIHHASYAQNYVDQFGPRATSSGPLDGAAARDKNKARIEALIDERPADEAARIRKSRYGVSLSEGWRNALSIAPVAAVTSLLTTVAASTVGISLGAPFVAASTLASLALVPASKVMHPYLHMTRAEAFETAGPLMRRFLQSEYVGYIARAHYVHHKDARVNQNLVPGADYLSGFSGASVEAIVALRKMKTFY